MDANKEAIINQTKVIQKIAERGSSIIVGRASNYVLRDNDNLVRIFIYADEKYKIKKLHEMYGDTEKEARKNMTKSNKNRAAYYKMISGNNWGECKNYDLLINSSIGTEETANIIVEYINTINK